ncbi:type VII secretion-associated serine protease mycosin [Streptomyces sp. B-S-A8]|uniref:Type VII secretion-associated serine protease mycosin n=1 Tax=Streptomyces solicavernae TaxID=3043614 RepID=A0ABT6RZU1_9ACTN|nr:type VII secretion-associated serine protease mycosin [Streptomyces sp. B-S-A8]MDI3389850.1 type VII secretion-associated serine protease mycosin [Streptomyces sp. B-S-A8]
MHTSNTKTARRYGRTATAALGMLLATIPAAPAHAESIRERQWHLDAMHAEEMWKTSTGKGVTVAVIDSGVESPMELQGQILKGKDLTSRAGDEHDDFDGHGTSMAGLIAATGVGPAGNGAFGLAPGAKILPVRVPVGMGPENFDKALGPAIRYAADSDAQILNISLATTRKVHAVEDAIKYALSKGKLVFAGVGNDGQRGNPKMYPAALPGVVGMAAISRDLTATEESNHGPQVDLAAPGDEMVTACAGKTGVCEGHGTSDATAIASASAALIWSKHPNWTNNQVLRVMLNTASKPNSGKERTDYLGYGAIRPRIALKNPGDPGPADEYPLPDFPAQTSESPSPEGSEPNSGTDDRSDTEASDSGVRDDNSTIWVTVGIGSAALFGLAVAALVARSRRRTTGTG